MDSLAFSDLSPSRAGFLGIVPIAIFAFVGFELQANAAEEMVNPQRDIPVSVWTVPRLFCPPGPPVLRRSRLESATQA